MVPVLLAVAQALGVLTAVHAVMSTRTSQGATAWVLSLVLMPIFAVPAYWVFGRNRFRGYVLARRSQDLAVQARVRLLKDRVLPFVVPQDEMNRAAHAAERLVDMPFLTGNQVDLLIDGTATFDDIERGIEAAEHYILFQFYIVHDDGLGRRMKDCLVAKARAGVRVHFLYDEVGSHGLPRRFLRELEESGVEVAAFHTRQGRGNRFQINFRNHRKVVVVDGTSAWVGGHNVGDEYLGLDARIGRWRDTHMRIDGPAALGAQVSFLEDWHWATGSVPQLAWKPEPHAEGEARVLVAPTGPADDLESAGLMFVHAIDSAQERIWIASPYFVPDRAVIAALHLAGMRGVDVRILIPDRADHLLVYLAAFTYFDEVARTGTKFFRYTDGFLHQKVVLIDDVAASVGTANFDNRSFRLNFEVTAMVVEPAFVSQVETMLLDDFGRSRPVGPEEFTGRSFGFRLAARLARLTSPAL